MERHRVINAPERARRIAEILLASQVRAQVLRWVRQRIFDREDAEDVVAVLVEKVARTYPDAVIERSQVLAVAFQAAKTISLDEIRRQRSDKRGGAVVRVPFDEDCVGFYLQASSSIERDWVEGLLKRLPEDLQPVARLHVFEGLEITEALRAGLGNLDERKLATARARWYHHMRKLQAIASLK